MKEKIKLEELEIASFCTNYREEQEQLKGGDVVMRGTECEPNGCETKTHC
jgi:hypothetical protein